MNKIYTDESIKKLDKKIKKDLLIFALLSCLFLLLFILIIIFEKRETKTIFIVLGSFLSFIYFSYLFYYLSYVNKRDKILKKNMVKTLNSDGETYNGHVVGVKESYDKEFLTYEIDIIIDGNHHTFKSIKDIEAKDKDVNIIVSKGYIKEYEIL